MQAKTYGLFSAALVAAALAVSVAYAAWLTGQRASEPQRLRVPPLPPVPQVPPGLREGMQALRGELPRLAVPLATKTPRVDLTLFGYAPVDRNVTGLRDQAGSALLPRHTVSMTFVSTRSRFCVIDDRFYIQGATLEDGVRVARVQKDRVLLEGRGLSEWREVRNAREETTPDPQGVPAH